VEQPKIEPPPQVAVPTPTSGQEQRNVLAISPTPAKPKPPIEVPEGEVRGRFVISPEPTSDPVETTPGTKSGSPTATAVTQSETTIASAVTAPSTSSVVTIGRFGGGTGSGGGAGAGAGTGTGSGSGAGAGPGKGPFAGISVVGGAGPSGSVADSSTRIRPATRPLQTGSYGVTVISTENAGGGLPISGVFGNERIHTVYLDMRQAETDQAPSWILEFALLEGTGGPAATANGANQGEQGLILPYPAVKEQPVLPAEIVRKFLRKVVIVYGIINTDGRMEQMSVKDSPWVLVNEPIMSALSKWLFRPARLNGKPVAVKVLMGIPLWIPD
jgi:hypothetical protein